MTITEQKQMLQENLLIEGVDAELGKVYQQNFDSKHSLDILLFAKNDFEFSHQMDVPEILKSHRLEEQEEKVFLIKEHFSGKPITTFLRKNLLTEEILSLGILVAEFLKKIHNKGIIHRNLTPESILVNDDFSEIKVINMGFASEIKSEKGRFIPLDSYKGSLHYISPEQTGRIGRNIDYRSDYYTLGVLLYALFVGKPPFNFNSKLELIHAHIAKIPEDPCDHNKKVPSQVAKIILKLLEKNSENRYQSAEGLLADLKECKKQWLAKKQISSFTLGKKDRSRRFILSDQLYGRKKELTILNQSFKRITNGPIELVYVEGYSGIGKTRLIEELQSSVSIKRGFTVSGKFDQHLKDTPYFAFTQIFNALIHQMMGHEEEELLQWKEKFDQAMAGNGQALLKVIPDLELIMGKLPSIFNLGYEENKKRFNDTITSFLKVLDDTGQPVMIFIDDLQWADRSSLQLIDFIMESDLQNFLLIGSYRSNEVDSDHPLAIRKAALEEEHRGKVHTITLTSLELDDVNQMIADSFDASPRETLELSKVVQAKTKGNPFFIRQFLVKLVEENHIQFDLEQFRWRWSTNDISKLEVTENVVDLVIRNIQKLSPEGQQLISLASCIGNTFTLEELWAITHLNEEQFFKAVREVVYHFFIFVTGKYAQYSLVGLSKTINIKDIHLSDYRFVFHHDKIQQAAYTLIPEADRARSHYQIGKSLIESLSESEIDTQIFDILDHLNIARDLISNEKELLELGKLNLKAGLKAKNATAIDNSYRHLTLARELLEKEKGEDYLSSLIHSSECAFLMGDYDLSESLFDEAIENAGDPLMKAEIYQRKMVVYENTQRHELALKAAAKGLSILGTQLPAEETQEMVFGEFGDLQQYLEGKTPKSLLNHLEVEDERIKLTMKLLMSMWGPVYLLSRQNLLAFMILRMVKLSILHGNSIESALAYSFYGYLISAQMQQFELGYEFAQLGIDLNRKLEDTTLRSKVLVIAEGCVAHWVNPYEKQLQSLHSAYEYGIENNDTIYAGYAVTFSNRSQFLRGLPLNEVYGHSSRYLTFTLRINSEISKQQILSWHRVVVDLTGLPNNEYHFGSIKDGESHRAFVRDLNEKNNLPLPLANFLIASAYSDYFTKDYERGLQDLEEAAPLIPSVLGLPEHSIFNVMVVLHLLGQAKTNPRILEEKKDMYEEYSQKLAAQAATCPANYGSFHLLAEGDVQYLAGNYDKSYALYERALLLGEENKMLHIVAVSHEMMADNGFRQGNFFRGFKHLKSAFFQYKKWGANVKVEKIQEMLSGYEAVLERSGPTIDQDFTSESLDLQSIIDTATTISSEVVFKDLLDRLLEILIKNAGAQNAYLFLVKRKKIYLEACVKLSNNLESEIGTRPLSDIVEIPQSLIRLACNSGETILINDAEKDLRIKSELEKVDRPFESILCLPIVHHNKVTGVVYLENNASKHAFLPERIRLLQLLSGQIAISLENAQLYRTLEQKVQDRTKTIENQKQALVLEKQKADNLLLNILPHDVAEILKHEGYYTPKLHENVSILFTDFEDFTEVSQKISPQELVEMIDTCYKVFDEICDRYQVEKIKTIGDAYMCVAGLVEGDQDHAMRMVNAAKEMMEFSVEYNEERTSNGLPYCDLRIGIHSGSVVAGVVGKNKFAFDIWGDSVNTASRMQSHGKAQRINISEHTYRQLDNSFQVIDRGMMEVKNKGKLRMYFVL